MDEFKFAVGAKVSHPGTGIRGVVTEQHREPAGNRYTVAHSGGSTGCAEQDLEAVD